MFEKIFLTSLVISVLLIVIALILENEPFEMFSGIYFISHIVFIFGYLVIKFIGLIWGVDIDLFPNVSFVANGV